MSIIKGVALVIGGYKVGTVEKVTHLTNTSLEKFRKFAVYIGEQKNIRKKAGLYDQINYSVKEKKEIDSFFKRYYGRKISHKWHKLYQSYTGTYHVDYFPEILFSTKLEPKLNDYFLAKQFNDKNLLNLFFEQSELVTLPKTFISCVNGTYRDYSQKIISKADAVDLLGDIGQAVVKKTIDTSSGRDVLICSFSKGTDLKSGLSAEEIVDEMGNNFIAQERIRQSEDVSQLYSKSLNTFRVVSYIVDDKVYIGPISLRMGRNNAEVDNVHHGGITIGVSKEGYLREAAFSEFKETFAHHPDTGFDFSGHQITHVGKLIDGAKELHGMIPHLKIISWDLCLNQDNHSVLIEMNTIGQSVWFPQMVNGEPMFGEHTAYMLNLISNK